MEIHLNKILLKKSVLILLATSLISFFAGCATSGKEILRTQKDPIALVSVVSNSDINWNGEESINPNVAGFFTKKALKGGSDQVIVSSADQLIGTAEGVIRDCLANTGKINLADKDTVINSRAYQNAVQRAYQINQGYVKPDDYRFIDYRDKNFSAALDAETGIQRSMFVEFNFTKAMSGGFGKNGSCRALVDITVNIQDNQGKSLYRKTFSLKSKDTTKVTAGVYSGNELMALFESAIYDACYAFLDNLDS